jgi:cytidylate kinase
VIAIDGPTASGKGTVAIEVAQTLGFHYLDSGALYRLVALASQQQKIQLDDVLSLAKLAAQLKASFSNGRVFLNGEDVGDSIRSEAIGLLASKLAVLAEVRRSLIGLQRSFRQNPGLVADGRDMASVIFPDASLKVFLTASTEARAERRYKQLIAKGFSANMTVLLQDLRDRDERDMSRQNAPLQRVEGALLLDTSQLTVDQAVQQVLNWYSALSQ